MKIIPKYQTGGLMTGVGRTSDDWYNNIFNSGGADSLLNHTLEMLAKYGDEYMNWVNKMQTNHSKIYNQSGGSSNKWKLFAPRSLDTKNYLHEYANNPYTDYNYRGITNAFNNKVFLTPGKRISGDRPYEYKNDELYSSITDFRRLLGRKGDWDNLLNLNDFKKHLNKLGYDIVLDKDNYYKLRNLNTEKLNLKKFPGVKIPVPEEKLQGKINPIEIPNPEGSVTADPINDTRTNKLSFNLNKYIPNILSTIRLKNALSNNERIYDTVLKGIRPNLLQSYLTHRQVVGDEATKQAYYRRATLGLTKAALPFTSDADRLMAYQYEAKRIGDELRAQGDLADNQEIRRTSDESNQHQWANAQRLADVANYNSLERNKALAAKQLLLAQKYAADHSSIDNYLLEKLSNIEKNNIRQEAINNEILQYRLQTQIEDDPEILAAIKDLDNAITRTGKDSLTTRIASENLNKARKRAYLKFLELYRNEKYGNGIILSKRGSKLTLKDDLLYKTAKDIVKHFREMSKMTDNSRIRSSSKKINLIPHPRKMLQGGLAPFVVYRPLALGGEQTSNYDLNSSGRTSSSSSTKEAINSDKEMLDLVKKLFTDVSTKGIPIDVDLVYKGISDLFKMRKLYGLQLSTEDIAGLYLSSMLQLSHIDDSKKVYDSARNQMITNNAIGEFAVTADGSYIVQNKDGDIVKASLELIEKLKLNPLKNSDLLFLRKTNPSLAFGKGDLIIEEAANGSVGIDKITTYLNNLIGTIGSSDLTIEGLSEVESNKVKQGLQMLAEGASNGRYEVLNYNKNSILQIKHALNYIQSIMPDNYKAILDLHITKNNLNGDSPIKNRNEYILSLLGSRASDSTKQTISGGSKTSSSGSSTGGDGKTENSAGLAFVLGQGPREIIDLNTGSSYAIRVLGIKGTLLTKSEENLGQGSTLLDATKSLLGGYLEWGKATFGGSKLNSGAYSHIILNDSTIIGMDLPYTKDINGNEVPNFLMLKQLEAADEEISYNKVEDINSINTIYLKHGLPPKYNSDGKLNKMYYKRYAAIQATLDEKSLESPSAILSDLVSLAGEVERDLYESAMKKEDNKYNLSSGMWITGWGKDLLYKGTIFIPYNEDIAFAALSSGKPFKQGLPNNAATIQQMLYAPRAMNYKAPDATLSQIIEN